MSGRAGKPLDWTRAARREYLAQLGWIAAENPLAAELVRQRIEHSLDLIRLQPGLGTPGFDHSISSNARSFARVSERNHAAK